MIDSVIAIPGWQVYVWILAICLPAAIHLRAARVEGRARRSEAVLVYVLGVSGAIGTVGFACFWRYDFWLPAIIAKSVFAWGAGLTHVLDIDRTGNVASNNAGPILAWDFLLPVAMVTLYVLARPARDQMTITPARYWSTRSRLDAEGANAVTPGQGPPAAGNR